MIINDFITGPYDCYQSVMANIAAHYGHVYQTVALGKISFMYRNEKNNFIGKRIDALHMRKDLKIDELLGLERKEQPLLINCVDEMDCLLEKNIPIVVWADLYNCNWNQAYHKYHFKHYFLINGKVEGKSYVIADPFFHKFYLEQSLEELTKIADSCIVYKKKEIKQDRWNEIEEEILKDAQYYLDNDMGNNIVKFSTALKDIDFSKEFNYPQDELYAIPMLDNLKIVGEQREAYAKLLKYTGANWNKVMLEATQWLLSSAELWGKLRIYFMKMILTNSCKCDNALIVSYLENIRQLEEKTFRTILKKK